jgi:hypothetical protein
MNLTCSSSYDGSFSVFFFACASQFYDASFFYHKAYSNNFLILFINKFYPEPRGLPDGGQGASIYFFNSAILFSIAAFSSGSFVN